jgi:hypothetical protein
MDVAVPKETVKPVGPIGAPVSVSGGGPLVVPKVGLDLSPTLNIQTLGSPLIQAPPVASPLLLPAPAAALTMPNAPPPVSPAVQPNESAGETKLSPNLVQTKSGDNSREERAKAQAESIARELNTSVRSEEPSAVQPNAGPIADYAGFLKKNFSKLFAMDADLTRLADDQRVKRALLADPDALVEALLLNYRSEPADHITATAMKEMAQIHKQLIDFIGATLKDKTPQSAAVRKALETRFLHELAHRDFGRTRQVLGLITLLEPASDEILIAVLDAGIRDTYDLDGENTFESAAGAIQTLEDIRLTKGQGFYRTFFERYLTLEREGRLYYNRGEMSSDLDREMKTFLSSINEREIRGIEPLLVEFAPQIKDPEMRAIALIHLSKSGDPQRRLVAIPLLRALTVDLLLDYDSVREPAALALLNADYGDEVAKAFLREALAGNEANVFRKAGLAVELLKGNRSDRAAMRFLLGRDARENIVALVAAAAFFPHNKGAVSRLIAEIGRRAAKPGTLTDLGHDLNRYPAVESVVDEFARHRDEVPEKDRERFDLYVTRLRARQIPNLIGAAAGR